MKLVTQLSGNIFCTFVIVLQKINVGAFAIFVGLSVTRLVAIEVAFFFANIQYSVQGVPQNTHLCCIQNFLLEKKTLRRKKK